MNKRVTRHRRQQTKKKPFILAKYLTLLITVSIGVIITACILFCAIESITLLHLHTQKLDMTNLEWHKDKNINLITAYIHTNGTLDSVGILSLDQKGSQLVAIPAHTSIMVNGNAIELQTMYALEKLQNDTHPLHTVIASIEQNTLIPIDGYLFVRADAADNPLITLQPSSFHLSSMNIVNKLMRAQEIHNLLDHDIYTNLSVSSLSDLADAVSGGLKPAVLHVKSRDITNGVIVTNNFSSDISSQLSDTYVKQEHARISVYNGSQYPGEADFVAALLQNEGAIIDYVGNVDHATTTTIYTSSANNFPATIEKIKRIVHGSVQKKQYSITSDISIVLGDDIATIF